MSRLRLERHQLSQLQTRPEAYRAVSDSLTALEGGCFYPLNAQYQFQIRHDEAGDYFAFFRYLADGEAQNVYTLLFRNSEREVVGCCQIVLQVRGGEVYAYFCDLKVAPAYRRRALKQLALYLLRDAFSARCDSLLAHYCRLQGGESVDIKLYFVNMGGGELRHNGLVRICRYFARLFVLGARLMRRRVSLHVHIKRGWVAAANRTDLSGTVPAKKKIVLFDAGRRLVRPLDLHHAPAGTVADDPNVDYGQTVVMALSNTPTVQSFTLFYAHRAGAEMDAADFLPHPGMI